MAQIARKERDMRLQLWFDKVSTGGDIKTKVKHKFSSLDKYLKHVSSDLREGMIKLSKGDRFGYKVKAIFRIPGREVVAEGKSETLLSAIDSAYAKASREIKKHVDKLKLKRKT